MARYEPVLVLPAAILIASSPIMFFFGRLALLETPMLVFVLLAMLTVARIPAHGQLDICVPHLPASFWPQLSLLRRQHFFSFLQPSHSSGSSIESKDLPLSA